MNWSLMRIGITTWGSVIVTWSGVRPSATQGCPACATCPIVPSPSLTCGICSRSTPSLETA